MYAILNVSPGWGSAAELTRISKAIISLITGSSLASVRDNAFSGSSVFNFAKSSRVASNLQDFWIKDTDTTAHAPCDTAVPKTKYLKVEHANSHIMWSLSSNAGFVLSTSNTLYNYNSGVSAGNATNIHVFCNEACVVVAFATENSLKPGCFGILSEITYDAMPYIDDDTNSVIPVVISNVLGYNPKIVGSGSETQNPFQAHSIMTDYDTGTVSTVANINLWRIGNVNVSSNPTTLTVGDSRFDPVTQTEVEGISPFGVAYQSPNAIFIGSITDKSGIMFMNGLGYPAAGDERSIPPDVIVSINSVDYVVLDKFLIPYV